MDTPQIGRTSEKFQALLAKLQIEHEREINEFRNVIAELQTKVHFQPQHTHTKGASDSPRLYATADPLTRTALHPSFCRVPAVALHCTDVPAPVLEVQDDLMSQASKKPTSRASDTETKKGAKLLPAQLELEDPDIRPSDTETKEDSKLLPAQLDMDDPAASLWAASPRGAKPFQLKESYTAMPVSSGVWGMEFDHELSRHNKKPIDISKLKESKSLLNIANETVSVVWRFSLHPNSYGRTCWDYASIVLVVYDMVSIPLLLCFEPEQSLFGFVMAWVTLLFWTADMFVSGVTGYYKSGTLIMDKRAIIINYLKFWFAVDCIVVVPDWYMKILSGSGGSQYGYIGRSLRIMRGLRLLRLLKLQRLLTKMYDLIDSEYSFLVFGLCRLLLVLLVLNHFVACAWFGLGALSKSWNYDKNWLDDVGLTPVTDTTLAWQYTTSLHWAITQFTPASMDVYATNIVERIFSVVVLFGGLLAVSSVIANITASLTTLRNMGNDASKQMWMLRRYLKERRISPQSQERVVKYLEWEVRKNKQSVPTEQVVLLQKISPALKMELSAELGAPIIAAHPLFVYLLDPSVGLRSLCIKICDIALSFTSYGEGDFAFESEQEALAMYFIKSGGFDYFLQGHVEEHMVSKISSSRNSKQPRPFKKTNSDATKKTWLSEAALWTGWQHRGALQASQPGELCCLSPLPFADILRLHPRTFHLGADYGAKFVDLLNSKPTGITDIIIDCDLYYNVIACDSYTAMRFSMQQMLFPT